MEERLIKDDIVRHRLEECGADMDMIQEYNSLIGEFQGRVNSKLEPVKLNGATFGLAKLSIIDSLEAKFKAINVKSEDCYIDCFGNKARVDKDVLRFMKALCQAQQHKSAEYSQVLSGYFYHIMSVIFNVEDPMVLSTLSSTGLLIVKTLNDFVSNNLSDRYTVHIPEGSITVDTDSYEVIEVDT